MKRKTRNLITRWLPVFLLLYVAAVYVAMALCAGQTTNALVCLVGMATIWQYSVTLSGPGVSVQKVIPRSGDHPNPFGPVALPAGKSGSLTTRTDSDTGTFLCAAHGLAVNDKVDVYWSTTGNIRYGMTVTVVVDANNITLDLGGGDNLPIATTVVVITKQVVIDPCGIDGSAITIATIDVTSTDQASTSMSHVHFVDASGTTIAERDLIANQPQVVDVTGGSTNFFNPSVAATFTVVAATNVFTSAAHGLLEGHQVKVSSATTLPAGLLANTWYFIKWIDANTYKVALTLGGTEIDVTDTGTGTHTWTRRNLISKAYASCGSSAEAITILVASLEDSTP